jgi:hypothetical protein
MKIALPLLLFQLGTSNPVPTPTPAGAPMMNRSTPIPAGGSLQDLAKRRRGFSPGDAMQGTLAKTQEGTAGELRHEGLVAHVVEGGLLVEGTVVDERRFASPSTALEVFARRRNGGLLRGIAPFDVNAAQKGGARFFYFLRAPTGSADPASVRPETAGGRFHVLPQIVSYSAEGLEYLNRTACLHYWGKAVPAPKGGPDDHVEVHVGNDCAGPVRAADTWFVIRIQTESKYEAHDRKVYGLFLEDVPPRTEIKQVVPAPVPRGRGVRVERWRLELS